MAPDAEELEEELETISKKKTARKKQKKKSRMPALQLEKVPSRPKMSKTVPVRLAAVTEEEDEAEEEEE